MARSDFENWIGMLGDDVLADQIASLRQMEVTPSELQRRLIIMVGSRLKKLRQLITVPWSPLRFLG